MITTGIKIANSITPKIRLKPQMLEGIHLFKGLSSDDVDFVRTKLETVNLFRGCTMNCSHCLKNAQPPLQNNSTILFEDLVEFTDGFKELSERAGGNVLENTKYLSVFDDSNPSDYPIKGLTRNHSAAEAMKLIYKKLGIPTIFVTSGWNPKSKYAQGNAEEIVQMIKKDPDSVFDLQVSVNPFAGILNKAGEALRNGQQKTAEALRNLYVTRMANTLATFADLFKTGKASIIYRHANYDIKGVDEKAAKELYTDIFHAFKSQVGEKADAIPQLAIEKVTKPSKSHLLESSGRARQYFPPEYNFREQAELINDKIRWDSMDNTKKMEILKNIALKGVDINGEVYATFPSFAHYEFSPIELNVKTPIRLNYQNTKPTKPLFCDIKLKNCLE